MGFYFGAGVLRTHPTELRPRLGGGGNAFGQLIRIWHGPQKERGFLGNQELEMRTIRCFKPICLIEIGDVLSPCSMPSFLIL